MKRLNWSYYLIHGVFPLILGALIYLIADRNVLFLKWLSLSNEMSVVNHPVLTLIRNYGCDFCWAYSLSFVVLSIIGIERGGRAIGLVVCFEIILELSQLSNSVVGTFDPLDILVEILANLLVLITCRKGKKHETLD